MNRLPTWVSDGLAFPRVIWVAMGAALLVSLPTLAVGFVTDDFTQQAVLAGLKTEATPFDLFRFTSGDPEAKRPLMELGAFPWWTLPELKLSFWRPLSSALMVMDHALFGRWAPGHHLHSVLWYLGLVAAAGLVLRRVLPGRTGGLALLVFAVDAAHSMPVAWIANRNALVAVTPALFGLAAHLRYREDGWRPGLPLSLLGYAVGLLGGEAAFGVFGLLGAYELFGRDDRLPRRLGMLVPGATLGLAYLIAYKRMGYGAAGSGMYVDATDSPLAFALVAPMRILRLVGGELSVLLPAELSLFGEGPARVQVVVSVLAIIGFAWLLRRAWPGMSPEERRGTKWLLAGSLISLIPVAATFPANRLLLVASLGGAVAVTLALRDAWRRWKGTARERRGARAVVALVGVPHLVLSPLFFNAGPLVLKGLMDGLRETVQALYQQEGCCEDRELVVLAGSDFTASLDAPMLIVYESLPPPKRWRVLSIAPCTHRVERTGPATLELSCVDGQMLATEFEHLFRAPRYALGKGARVELPDITATVLEDTPEGGVERVRFDFRRPLEDPGYLFLSWRGGYFRPTALPPVGGNLTLPLDMTPAGRGPKDGK
ncbi:MAG TPA: hypothetical protein VK420_03700 [Longimicrobium sp.]|nr:hypothetical protein [Longimicrobium sp.]